MNPRFRLAIATAVLVSGAIGGIYGYRGAGFNDVILNEELAFAFGQHLVTVRELAEHARANAIEPAAEIGQALLKLAARPDVRSGPHFAVYVAEQGRLTGAARELIAVMDGEIDPSDDVFARLIRRFESEERGLARLGKHRRVKAPLIAFIP